MITPTKYAGAGWIEQCLKVKCSPLGRAAADLLGEVWAGIYHLDRKELGKVNWASDHVIIIRLAFTSLSTYDNETLTLLVVRAHDYCLRLDVRGAGKDSIELMFHQRQRTGSLGQRMPTMEAHLAAIRKYYPIAETTQMALIGGIMNQHERLLIAIENAIGCAKTMANTVRNQEEDDRWVRYFNSGYAAGAEAAVAMIAPILAVYREIQEVKEVTA